MQQQESTLTFVNWNMRRIFLFILFLFVMISGYSQKKECPFAFESLILPDSIYSLQLLDTIKSIPLKTCNRKDQIPPFIQEALDCWTGKFDIANPGRAFHSTDVVGWRSLPHRQLMYLGLSDHYLLIAYKHGGRGFNTPVIFFKFDNEKIVSVWYWMLFDKGMTTKENILQSLQGYPDTENLHYFL
jgi:hypothetical protein